MNDYQDYIDRHEYRELIRLIDHAHVRATKRAESADAESAEVGRARADASDYLAWYYTWLDHLDHLEELDRQHNRAKSEHDDLNRESKTAPDEPKRMAKRCGIAFAVSLGVNVVFHDVWILYVPTVLLAVALAFSAVKVAQVVAVDRTDEINSKKQEMKNIREARRVLLNQIDEARPSAATIELGLLTS
jgi:hypothetical protein